MGSYKRVSATGTVSDAESAIDSLKELGSECREIVDNASDGLKETQRIQTLEETADALEDLDMPDIPEAVAGLSFDYHVQENRRKGRGPSRAVRRDNEVELLSACQSAVDQWVGERIAEIEEEGGNPDDHDEVQEAEQFSSELGDIISNAESAEFPGMFG